LSHDREVFGFSRVHESWLQQNDSCFNYGSLRQGNKNMNATLATKIWPQTQSSNLVRNIVLAVIGSLVVAGAAQVTVPMYPVPMTLQTLAVLGVGAAYGARLGAATLLLYAIEGAVGLPFFAGGKSGLFDAKLEYLLPSGSMGYVVGFILAAWLVGKLVESGWANSLAKSGLAALIGGAVLYVPGVIWLAIWASKTMNMDAATATTSALSWGLYPFIVGDVIKAVLAGVGVPAIASLFSRKS
jgi:biotin transport system substrate-specific component